MGIIRRIDLTMDEQRKYEVIKKLVEGKGNKNAAALKLGITPRHVNRLIEAYKKKGKKRSYMETGEESHPEQQQTESDRMSSISTAQNTLIRTLLIIRSC